MLVQIGADRVADKVCAIGVEPLLDQQVDLAQVDDAEVDGDLFRVCHNTFLLIGNVPIISSARYLHASSIRDALHGGRG